MTPGRMLLLITLLAVMAGRQVALAAEVTDFSAWKAQLWPDAERFGISRRIFDDALAAVEPDFSLPDLRVEPKGTAKRPGQAEFTRPPQAYVREASIARLAAEGRLLAVKHRATLDQIERRFGVAREVVLAIWGRETAYGQYRVKHDAIRALATQAFMGRRPDLFRRELLFALKMLQDRVITRAKFRSSWAGAVGLTQFMPSEFDALAVDLDGDGRKDIWSVPDALGSAANQLKQKGWLAGQPWGYEVRLPSSVTCAEDGPLRSHPVRYWVERGVQRADGRAFSPASMEHTTFMFSPGGGMGPQFLATENFLVFKRYNMSDLYALFVGHLSDRIVGGASFIKSWGEITQLPSAQIEAVQTILKAEGFAIEKIDGRIGPNTRSQIGTYQLRAKLAVDCWPSMGLLREMRARSGSDPGGRARARENKN